MQYLFLMRILSLFLALFLTLLPEGIPVENCSQVQDVCWEDVEDIEEEAVIKIPQCDQRQVKESSKPVSRGIRRDSIHFEDYLPQRPRFERQWLTHCRLRL